jgi:hypothetical protein
MSTKLIATAAVIALFAFINSAAWAVNKCSIDGKTVFQDAPCPGKGETMVVRPASGRGTGAATPALAPAPIHSAAAPALAVPAAPPAAAAAKSALELEADMCLAWYRPLLRDPKGAYYTNMVKEKRVFSMDLHATNGFGGYVIKRAACEIHNGKLNEAWTKIHAKRDAWMVE